MVKEYLQKRKHAITVGKAERNALTDDNGHGTAESKRLGLGISPSNPEPSKVEIVPSPPLCDRCHKLLHHSSGTPIHHPSLESIRDTIWESPWKYNHIYHVLDAADFPLSLIPQLQKILDLTPPRSQNRRSKSARYYRGRQYEMSFIITRSDLLAPRKEQVDTLMPYLVQTLRDALGRMGEHIRLGNVRCVSALRGWWTKELKEDIWRRGGGGWMVGKVNVGKSNLFECVFPKGRSLGGNSPEELMDLRTEENDQDSAPEEESSSTIMNDDLLDVNSLLPPQQPETPYPVMPLVSSLPGTTASPIRLLYGNGKGELVDLPGLSRGHLEEYIREEQRDELVMRSRVKPTQQVIKPGQSLLLGGLIRITPLSEDAIIMAYSFLPFDSHLTSTEKAIGIQLQQRQAGVETIAAEGIGDKIRNAGVFQLKWDVTRQRAGPLTSSSAVGLKVDRLPFRVMATDILIEGCGWVELVCQVRKREMERVVTPQSEEDLGALESRVGFPEVEIFSPEGKFVGQRRCMNGWFLNMKPKVAVDRSKGRPRRSMKGAKKGLKMIKRAE
ncbi:MAG: hypothetical protein M1816_002320 [Peltula sp. TS41687]|nr:MAG: hypothetical protein M1816_002320 [Peltula sp. TS41687]